MLRWKRKKTKKRRQTGQTTRRNLRLEQLDARLLMTGNGCDDGIDLNGRPPMVTVDGVDDALQRNEQAVRQAQAAVPQLTTEDFQKQLDALFGQWDEQWFGPPPIMFNPSPGQQPPAPPQGGVGGDGAEDKFLGFTFDSFNDEEKKPIRSAQNKKDSNDKIDKPLAEQEINPELQESFPYRLRNMWIKVPPNESGQDSPPNHPTTNGNSAAQEGTPGPSNGNDSASQSEDADDASTIRGRSLRTEPFDVQRQKWQHRSTFADEGRYLPPTEIEPGGPGDLRSKAPTEIGRGGPADVQPNRPVRPSGGQAATEVVDGGQFGKKFAEAATEIGEGGQRVAQAADASFRTTKSVSTVRRVGSAAFGAAMSGLNIFIDPLLGYYFQDANRQVGQSVFGRNSLGTSVYTYTHFVPVVGSPIADTVGCGYALWSTDWAAWWEGDDHTSKPIEEDLEKKHPQAEFLSEEIEDLPLRSDTPGGTSALDVFGE